MSEMKRLSDVRMNIKLLDRYTHTDNPMFDLDKARDTAEEIFDQLRYLTERTDIRPPF